MSESRSQGLAVRSLGTIGNLIWVVLAGIWLAIGYLVAAFFSAITIIGIPFAIQALKLAGYALWPFGKVVVKRSEAGAFSLIGNVIWFVLAGIGLAVLHFLTGVVLCLTIIGIPLGLANFKLARLALWPMGRVVVPAGFAR